MKVLFVASIMIHFEAFHLPYMQWFKQQGWKVHVAGNNDIELPYCDKRYVLPIERSPYKLNNIKAYKELKRIIFEENYDIVHCHTPVASILTRLAARKMRKMGTKVIYTAHGFHFYKGASITNWLIYYPIENWLSKKTDILITINKEDYERASKFKSKKVEYVPGVGIDTEKYKEIIVNKSEIRNNIDVPIDSFVVLSVGELNKNKNHETIIKSISKLNNPNIYYVICGQGPLENYLNKMVNELGVSEKVKFLGYRTDIDEICRVADIFAFPSMREGLPVSLMEAMASGLPVICSKIRGNKDLVEDGMGGYLVDARDINGFAESIQCLYKDKFLCEQMGRENIEAVKKFDIKIVIDEMQKIYNLTDEGTQINSGVSHERS